MAVSLDEHMLILYNVRLPIGNCFYRTPGSSLRLVLVRGVYQRPMSFMVCACSAFEVGEGARERMDIRSLIRNEPLLVHTDLAAVEHLFCGPKL